MPAVGPLYCGMLQVPTEANTIARSGSVSGQPMGFRFGIADGCLQICRPHDDAETDRDGQRRMPVSANAV